MCLAPGRVTTADLSRPLPSQSALQRVPVSTGQAGGETFLNQTVHLWKLVSTSFKTRQYILPNLSVLFPKQVSTSFKTRQYILPFKQKEPRLPFRRSPHTVWNPVLFCRHLFINRSDIGICHGCPGRFVCLFKAFPLCLPGFVPLDRGHIRALRDDHIPPG
jgi:hypothetical protein